MDTLHKVLKTLINSEINKRMTLQVWKVTDVNTSKYTVNIRDLNFKRIEHKDVPLAGTGMGNLKGIYKYPEPDDLVIVLFIGGEETAPVVLGTVVDIFSDQPDTVPQIKRDELLITHKTLGSTIYMKADNEIVIKVADSSGDLDGGARLKLSPSGAFKLFNKDNWGIECDSTGKLTIRSNDFDVVDSAGTF